ncbi:uncharacterized protein LOC133510090 [Syngnathoides biaculeatus]|uniref:uncharacterized protein LOC133510090 n=1 Tax=Syngnathoides biaculeatus TaxID=300417 RepID=UPI002ADD5504|nr:uncharacterized protein LOC133510090 [Syngnathoides biaculeatus]
MSRSSTPVSLIVNPCVPTFACSPTDPDPAGKTRRRRDRRKVDRLPEDQACPIQVGSTTSSASVSYAPPASYEYVPTTTRPAPHILLDSDFLDYEEDLDLYDRLPEYDSDYFDYESLHLIFHPSQFGSPPRVSSTRASSPGRSEYTTHLWEPAWPSTRALRVTARGDASAGRALVSVPVSTDSLPTLVHVAVETDSPPHDPHISTNEEVEEVGRSPPPPSHVHVQEEVVRTPPPASHVSVQEEAYQRRPVRGRSMPLSQRGQDLGSSDEPPRSWRHFGMAVRVAIMALVLLSVILFTPDGSQPLHDLASLVTNLRLPPDQSLVILQQRHGIPHRDPGH